MEHNCGFINDKKAFRYRAAAIIVEEGCVLFARNDEDDYYSVSYTHLTLPTKRRV